MKSIDEDIKTGNFARVYLLTGDNKEGDEVYLRLQYRDKLKKALCKPDDNLNVVTYSGKDVPVGEVIDFANTMPFLADKRVVFLEETNLFESANDELAEFIAGVPADSCLIFVQSKADQRGKLFKAIQKNGRVVFFKRPSPALIEKWILTKISQAGLKIRQSALTRFLEQVPPDMQSMSLELEKLCAYCLDKEEITTEDIGAICQVRTEDRIYEMLDRIVLRRKSEALEVYYELLTLKEPPMKILSLIGRQFSELMMVKSMKSEGFTRDQIREKTGLRDFVIKKSIQNGSRYSMEELTRILARCAMYEEDVKVGRMNDVMSVELLIEELVNPA
ncbi:MAG: DNA polymerase III subunit delta [Lachnospiraceae bacterium]|nr:DNA polymerase III subunit delta [Lachnospiraceae bacterium]